ncbi:MAG: methyltransferase domain-containing protein [Chloroflexota bacterium]|nr:methyltransferase domain-containing protein [Chloroflexota bacterium]
MEYPESSFDREDESDDSLFYLEPRLLVHIDDAAINELGKYLFDQLPEGATILDLMSSWRSHIPENIVIGEVYGLGMNSEEMSNNPQLDHWIVKDINKDPQLPYEENLFDTVMVVVSVQYITDPIEIFKEVNRVLKKNGKFHVVYSNRMFPTKATKIWKVFDDIERASLIGSYFANSGGWSVPNAVNLSPRGHITSDPLYAVSAQKE